MFFKEREKFLKGMLHRNVKVYVKIVKIKKSMICLAKTYLVKMIIETLICNN